MKNRNRFVAEASLFAALYAVGVLLLAPMSFGVLQVRVADALIPLSILLGWPVVVGVTLGNLVANALGSPFGIVDILGGTAANFVASYVAMKIAETHFRGSWLLGCASANVIVSVIVGGYITWLAQIPLDSPLWEIPIVSVLIGSTVSINIVGYLVLKALKIRMVK
ncbi:MAG: QueT transporter family protein [Thaumarchaeota archaeon]|nr:QueT transporter family protein [Nitrososphaerota archaeon]